MRFTRQACSDHLGRSKAQRYTDTFNNPEFADALCNKSQLRLSATALFANFANIRSSGQDLMDQAFWQQVISVPTGDPQDKPLFIHSSGDAVVRTAT